MSQFPQSGQDFATLSQPGNAPKITSLFDFSAEALEQFAFWLEQRGLNIPITQFPGWTQFTAQKNQVNTSETTASTSFTNLATTGPELTGLGAGSYIFWFGCQASNSGAGPTQRMGLSLNAAAVAATDQCQVVSSSAGVAANMMGAAATTFSAASNTVTAKYDVSSGTGTFLNRWLVALKYANA